MARRHPSTLACLYFDFGIDYTGHYFDTTTSRNTRWPATVVVHACARLFFFAWRGHYSQIGILHRLGTIPARLDASSGLCAGNIIVMASCSCRRSPRPARTPRYKYYNVLALVTHACISHGPMLATFVVYVVGPSLVRDPKAAQPMPLSYFNLRVIGRITHEHAIHFIVAVRSV